MDCEYRWMTFPPNVQKNEAKISCIMVLRLPSWAFAFLWQGLLPLLQILQMIWLEFLELYCRLHLYIRSVVWTNQAIHTTVDMLLPCLTKTLVHTNQ